MTTLYCDAGTDAHRNENHVINANDTVVMGRKNNVIAFPSRVAVPTAIAA